LYGDENSPILNEIQSLRIFFHPNISRIIRTNIVADKNMPQFPYIMTEYAQFGTLSDFCNDRFVDKQNNKTLERSMSDWHLLLRMLIQLIGTLQYLHDTHHMMHNDIHAGTVLVVSDMVVDSNNNNYNSSNNNNNTNTGNSSECAESNVLIKLADFTNCRTSDLDSSNLKPIPTHRAQEIWLNKEWDYKADVFSFAQTVAQVLLVKQKSFLVNYSVPDVGSVVFNAMLNGIWPPIAKEKSAIGIELADLVRDCWNADVDHRPTFEGIQTKLTNLETRYFPSCHNTQG
jgi:hypothetical protein